MRWDNECNVSIRLKDFIDYKVQTEGEKIKLINAEKEVHFYQIEEGEGASEFEVILKSKPISNVIEFTLEDKDVEYFYQPELTQEEIAKGAVRPDNVVGSYAVYAKTPKVNYVGGKEYKCGKVGHVFRPKIIDSAGTEVWGDLHIDVENGLLSVTIPQDFLDKAVYPVRHAAGLTFGYGTHGLSNHLCTLNTKEIWGSKFTGAAGTATSISFWGVSTSDANEDKFKLAIYVNSTSALLVKGSAFITGAGKPAQLQTQTISDTTISAVDYDLTVFFNNINWDDQRIYYDAGDANQGLYEDPYGNADYETPSTFTRNTDKCTIYCTYTAAASGPANLKTYNTNAKANIKSINTNLIANVKSLNTNV